LIKKEKPKKKSHRLPALIAQETKALASAVPLFLAAAAFPYAPR
jgi:hypothetical protein